MRCVHAGKKEPLLLLTSNVDIIYCILSSQRVLFKVKLEKCIHVILFIDDAANHYCAIYSGEHECAMLPRYMQQKMTDVPAMKKIH